MRKFLLIVALVLACSSSTPNKSEPPTAFPVEKGGTISFAEVFSQVMECPVSSLTWSTTGGTITPDGLYTAPGCGPGVPGKFSVTATGCNKTAFAEVDVLDTTITSLRVCIPFSMMAPGASQQVFTEITYQCPGHVAWSPFDPPLGYCGPQSMP